MNELQTLTLLRNLQNICCCCFCYIEQFKRAYPREFQNFNFELRNIDVKSDLVLTHIQYWLRLAIGYDFD